MLDGVLEFPAESVNAPETIWIVFAPSKLGVNVAL